MKLLEEKLKHLKQWFIDHPKVLIALSGGVDSCLVAYLARTFNESENVVALIGVSPSLKRRDLELAISFCKKYDINWFKIFPNEIEDENYSQNPANRCYYCKTALYREMCTLQKESYPDFVLLNGNNFSDLGDYRPGMMAAKENMALSPLVDCGIDKELVRNLAREYNLEVWDKPASPCLSSRFRYNQPITVKKLHMVEQAEDFVNSLGYSDVRVRIDNYNAKVEVPKDEVASLLLKKEILMTELFSLGFKKVEIDEEGLVSGKLNRDLS